MEKRRIGGIRRRKVHSGIAIAAATLGLLGCGGGGDSSADKLTTSESLDLTRASFSIAHYCLKVQGFKVGLNGVPSNRLIRKAYDGVSVIERLLETKPSAATSGRSIKSQALSAVGQLKSCDPAKYEELRLAVETAY